MNTKLSRRNALYLTAGAGISAGLIRAATPVEGKFAAIEHQFGGRLGVAAIDTGTRRRLAHRGTERFAMCSTFKLLLAGCVLKKADAEPDYLEQLIPYKEADLLEYAPATRAHVQQGGLSARELCAAAIEVSDNTAANLLLAQIGGPVGLTAFLRSLGDETTRLDRTEPSLNSALPGDLRDTTSPEAMAQSTADLLTGSVLSGKSRDQLAAWLKASTTGSKRLRAGVPAAWQAGDKTGTGERGAIGDVGVFWRPGNRNPIVIAAYVMEGNASAADREQAIAAAAQVVANTL